MNLTTFSTLLLIETSISKSRKPTTDASTDLSAYLPTDIDPTGHPDPPHPPQPDPLDLPLAEPHQPKKTGNKDPAPLYSEIFADINRPELIIPHRTGDSKDKKAYALAVVTIGHNRGFHRAHFASSR
jgi:hypothetical protein